MIKKRNGKYLTVEELYYCGELIHETQYYDWYVICGRKSPDFDYIMDQIADYLDDSVLLITLRTWSGDIELLIANDINILKEIDDE